MKRTVFSVLSLLLVAAASAEEAPGQPVDPGVKALSGMSILGNDEAPTSLVIVPWKSSELGDGLDMGNLLDDRASPVDKEVFLRELSYYDIRAGAASESAHQPPD